ncbi:hypothetical protein CROQUDRAFT_656478 [Cronartium quercuum f. sp. fusiforme G11]|uniref:Uncharacterized protein n=1 Tax=Cronartium quercuum f. sp. fusiforme G11 TaxID=708437 RepID=A0A9P6NKC5_9BASI|nr:hypothetical protein CROQUDRAFT_656478 [Cronartium quercuum f. sp. fusiforme G11]
MATQEPDPPSDHNLPPPPSYAEARLLTVQPSQAGIPHPFESSHHLPEGLFMIRNRSSAKVLDVRGGCVEVGSEVIAYEPKRPTLQDGQLLHRRNNQLFFLDWHGCLCAANSCLRVDVQNFALVLSSPQPISSSPSNSSHPPPQFRYDPRTRTISVHFFHDPTYSGTTLEQIHSVDYLLELQPRSRLEQPPPSASTLNKLSEWLPFAKSAPSSFSSSHSPASTSTSQTPFVPSSDPSLVHADPELDDDPEPWRAVKVVSVAPGWREKFPSSGTPEARKWLTRQWDIATIVCQTRREYEATASQASALDLSNLDSDPASLNHGVLAELGGVLGELGNEISRALGRST